MAPVAQAQADTSEHWWASQATFTEDGKKLLARLAEAPGKPGGVIGWDVGSGQVLFRHPLKDSPSHLLFSPEGTLYCPLPSRGGEREITIFSTATGKAACKPEKGAGEGLVPLAFSADDKLLVGITTTALPADGGVKFWDTRTGKRVHLFDDKSGQVLGVLFSSDNRLVLSIVRRLNAYREHELWAVVRDRHTGKEQNRFSLQTSTPEQYRLSPDGRYLASLQHATAQEPRILSVWDTQNGAFLYGVPTSSDNVIHPQLRFSADSSQVLTFGINTYYRPSYWRQAWTTATGRQQSSSGLPLAPRRDAAPLRSVLSPNGLLLARVTGENTIEVEKTETGEVVREIDLNPKSE